ncbi:structural contituent of cuticle [Holotrichia oblita]|uniref:Structural contituent of cuticle n=2 Tax=Holotrichia oblita TaxID=644536 RepID=A0ACB9SS79_HOLOL|nr:structural contituent of cuticle [Holotrichia oblita]KAI4457972.1 structural contituent of cuticle [Holotrichia oblita]
MIAKITFFVACATLAHAGVIAPAASLAYSAPIAKYAAPYAVAKTVVADDYDPNPQYSYAYDIQDGLTGDSKSQHESRNGDVVQGSYSLVDADGHQRIVEYTADPHNGFNAVVRREPIGKVLATAPVAKVGTPLAALPYSGYH